MNLKRYCTTLQAIDKTDGRIKTFVGNDVYSYSQEGAEAMVRASLPYLTIIGEFVAEIDEFTGKDIDLRRN